MSDHVTGVSQEDVDRARGTAEKAHAEDPHRATSAKELLKREKVRGLFPANRRNLVTASEKDTVSSVFALVQQERISAVPLEGAKQGRHVAFVDTVDLVAHFIGQFSQEELASEDAFKKVLAASKTTAKEVVSASKHAKWYPIEADAPLLTAVQTMVKHNCHRLPVVDGDELLTVVSQSAVLDYVSSHSKLFAAIASKTVGELQLGIKDVVAVQESAPAIDAFRLIHENGFLGVAIVDDKGCLKGNISASDLKVIGVDGRLISKLFVPAKDFYAAVCDASQASDKPISGPIAVTAAATIEEVVAKLEITKAHRVFVVEGEKLIGVISIVDLLAAFLHGV